MNLSKPKRIIKTKDGIPLSEGMMVYCVDEENLKIFKTKPKID